MSTGQKLQFAAILCWLSFGLLGTYLDGLQLENYGSLAALGVGLSGLYFGLDTFISPDKSLLLRFNKWLTGKTWGIRFGAFGFAIANIAICYGALRQLFTPFG